MDERFEQWLTGFLEGDGSVSFRYKRDNCGYLSLNPEVSFGQRNPEVLEYIKDKMGFGNMHKGGNSGMWYLKSFGQKRFLVFVEACRNWVVSEYYVSRFNAVITEMKRNFVLTCHKPTLDWFVGFWDAEGSSGNFRPSPLRPYIALQISVHNKNLDMISGVKDLMGVGSVQPEAHDSFGWRVGPRASFSVAEVLLERSHNPQKRSKLVEHIQRARESRVEGKV